MYVCCVVFVVCVYVRVVMTSKPPSLTEMIKCLVQQFSVAFTMERERERGIEPATNQTAIHVGNNIASFLGVILIGQLHFQTCIIVRSTPLFPSLTFCLTCVCVCVLATLSSTVEPLC